MPIIWQQNKISMNKKKIIQIIIIVIAFGASGGVLYNGFFKNTNHEALQSVPGGPLPGPGSLPSSDPDHATGTVPGALGGLTPGAVPAAAGGATNIDTQNLLLYGSKLDYSILDKNDLQTSSLTKPVLNSKSDVGIPEANLIVPPPAVAK